MPPTSPPQRLLRVGAVAEALDISERSVQYLIQSGDLPAINVSIGSQRANLRVRPEDLAQFLADRARKVSAA